MHFKFGALSTCIIVLGVFGIAHAASQTTTALTPTETCLKACNPGDVTCEAACVGAAHPDPSQADAAIQCIRSKCRQGNGSAQTTELYTQCVQQCIVDNFPTNQSAAVTVSTPTLTSAPVTGASTISVPSNSLSEPSSAPLKSKSGKGSLKSSTKSSNKSSASVFSSRAPPASTTPPNKSGGGGQAKASVPHNGAATNFKPGACFATIIAVFVAPFAL